MREIQNYYYESGAEAHQFETMPDHEERLRREEERRQRERRMRARSNARLLRAKKRKMVSLTVAVLILGCFFSTNSMSSISKTQKELSDLKAENAAIESRIATTAGLDQVRKKAMKKLGMKYATSKQVKYYTMKDEDYMSQYTESDK